MNDPKTYKQSEEWVGLGGIGWVGGCVWVGGWVGGWLGGWVHGIGWVGGIGHAIIAT